MLFAIRFLTMFLIGGIDGVFLASPPVDFALTETYWVIAHIHYVLFGGSVFAVYAGFYYWFPKFSGKKLNEGLAQVRFWLQFIGFNLTFFSMHILGLLGMPRRIQDYAALPDWIGINQLQTVGALIIALSTAPFLANVVLTMRRKEKDRNRGRGTPWSGTPPPRRRRTTSTACPRSTPSGRCSTCATPTSSPSIRRHHHRSPLMAVVDTAALDERPAEHHKPGGISSSLLGMVLFIASEVMFFGGLFGAYFTIRSAAPQAWPPKSAPVDLVRRRARGRLVSSSVTMQFEVWAIRKNDRLADAVAGHRPAPGPGLPSRAGQRVPDAHPRGHDPVQRRVRLDLLHPDRLPRRPRGGGARSS